ncbi:unnamed protein product [Phytophthora fragariaefolia]|uniref:Unnamed protein product n=1 Tax=Phytophthora fragariaefolia TaxID=1490495 RepID=A0A9W6TKG7_9STRA|nr:unnamed protein product [Phytophthora fragariaefolia]
MANLLIYALASADACTRQERDASMGTKISRVSNPKKRNTRGANCETNGEQCGDYVPSTRSKMSEYTPRIRASNHLAEMNSLIEEREAFVNIVPPLPVDTVDSWDEFDKVLNMYKKKNKLNFLIRSSETTVTYNRYFRCVHVLSCKTLTDFINPSCLQLAPPPNTRTFRVETEDISMYSWRFTAISLEGSSKSQVENHTHSHPTTSSEAATYMTTKPLPLSAEDREDVKTLVDARVSSAHITNVLNERTGHLIVTTATDRGFPAIDFMCLDEQAKTITTILEYSRGKIPSLKDSKTVVIDNDFVESNWNQFKMLFGRKTRINKTVAGLLQHQMTITQQIVSEIGLQHTASRMAKTVPKFLWAVVTKLSTNILEKGRGFVNTMEKATFEYTSTASVWKVCCSRQTFKCYDIDWMCSCLFYKSNHLPCRHVMYVAHKAHEFKVLPAISIHMRWNTFSVLGDKEDLAAAADALQPIVQMSKLRLPKERLPQEDPETDSALEIPFSMPPNNSKFYSALHTWKDIIEIGLRGRASSSDADLSVGSGGDRDGDNADSSNEDSDEDDDFPGPDVAVFEAASLMDTFETASLASTANSDRDELAPTQVAEVQQQETSEDYSVSSTSKQYGEEVPSTDVLAIKSKPLAVPPMMSK